MQMTFLGHQSWMLSHDSTNILIDPLLVNSFGHSDAVEFYVYPPRTVNLDKMPRLAGMILSHEHLDHFHLPSLIHLSKDVPVYVSTLMLDCVCEAIEQLGLKIHRITPGKKFQVGSMSLVFYPAAPETVFWEKRVHQIYAYPTADQSQSVFVAVDALVNKEFKSALNSGKIPPLRSIVCANNSQVVPDGAHGSHSNLLPIPDQDTMRNPGVSLLYGILDRYLKGLPPIPDVVLCGNGFYDRNQEFGPFLYSDNYRLAQIANELGFHEKVFGARPGDTYDLSQIPTAETTADWVRLETEEQKQLMEKQAEFVRNPVYSGLRCLLGKFKSDAEYQEALSVLQVELVELARALMLSSVGQLSVSINEHLIGDLDSKRILFRFLTDDGSPIQFALDLNRAEFIEDFTPTSEILKRFPFGVEMHLIDFVGILQGRLQIWDLAGTAMRSWYVGDRYRNVVAFLFARYGEQARPDLAAKVYSRALARLSTASHAAG